jgi:hypothetical protein
LPIGGPPLEHRPGYRWCPHCTEFRAITSGPSYMGWRVQGLD